MTKDPLLSTISRKMSTRRTVESPTSTYLDSQNQEHQTALNIFASLQHQRYLTTVVVSVFPRALLVSVFSTVSISITGLSSHSSSPCF